MISGEEYKHAVYSYFDFLVQEFGYSVVKETIKGNIFFDIQYSNQTNTISISFEALADYLLVIIYILENGLLPDYDDKTKTLHLEKLNASIFQGLNHEDIDLNNQYFAQFEATGQLEKKLLKSAKELRICLKHYETINK